MRSEYLVKMANEIAIFHDGNDADPASAVATHIERFWEPRMIGALIAHLEAGGAGLGTTARLAVKKLAEERATS